MTNETPHYYDTPVNALAREVAKTFGGAQELNRDGEYFEAYATVRVPAHSPMPAYELALSKRGWGAKASTLTVSIYPVERDNSVNMHGVKFPSAGMSMERGTEALCAQISKRVVNAPETLASLTEYAKRLKALKDRDTGLGQRLADLQRDCPNVGTSTNCPASGGSIRLFSRTVGTYFNATLYADGTVSFQSIGSVDMADAARILAILGE